MKQNTFKFAITLLILLAFVSCKKKEASQSEEKTVEDPYEYSSDVQSSKNIAFATSLICDIDMICAYGSQTAMYPRYFETNSTTPSDSVKTVKDISVKQMVMSFFNTPSQDGKLRKGSVFVYYGNDLVVNPNSNGISTLCEQYGYASMLFFDQYSVNGWQVSLFDSTKPPQIVNTVNSSLYDPSVTNLTWEISGKLKFTNPSLNMTIVWDGKLTKTLINTNDTNVFRNKNSEINWNLAKVSYKGSVVGSESSSSKDYTYMIDDNNPLIRDFTCSFSPPSSVGVTKFHPFISGISTFKIGNYHPRTINYGPGNSCDNNGTVSFNGESHNVDFE